MSFPFLPQALPVTPNSTSKSISSTHNGGEALLGVRYNTESLRQNAQMTAKANIKAINKTFGGPDSGLQFVSLHRDENGQWVLPDLPQPRLDLSKWNCFFMFHSRYLL